MKNHFKYLMLLAVAALTACSSMEVNEAESVEENFPADFVAAEYLELHPANDEADMEAAVNVVYALEDQLKELRRQLQELKGTVKLQFLFSLS